jgi:hypothetical protein
MVHTVPSVAISSSVNGVADAFRHIYSPKTMSCVTPGCEKSQQPTTHTAEGRVVEEHEIATSETDGDLHVFMDEHENQILTDTGRSRK